MVLFKNSHQCVDLRKLCICVCMFKPGNRFRVLRQMMHQYTHRLALARFPVHYLKVVQLPAAMFNSKQEVVVALKQS